MSAGAKLERVKKELEVMRGGHNTTGAAANRMVVKHVFM